MTRHYVNIAMRKRARNADINVLLGLQSLIMGSCHTFSSPKTPLTSTVQVRALQREEAGLLQLPYVCSSAIVCYIWAVVEHQ